MQDKSSDTTTTNKDSVASIHYSYTHIFEGNELQSEPKTAEPLVKQQLVWPFGIFLITLILLVTIRVASYKRFLMLLKAYFSLGASRQLIREEYKLNKGSAVLYNIVFILCFAFFLFKINQIYKFNTYSFNHIYFYLILCGIIFLSYTVKLIFMSLLARLTNSENENEEYTLNIFLSTNATGLFIFPVAACMEYSYIPIQYLVYAGCCIFLLFYFIRIAKGIIIVFGSGRFSVFHLFLYLCALEILPLIVAIKLFMSNIF